MDFPAFFSTTMRKIDYTMERIIVITNCQKSSPLAKEHFEKLHEKSKKYDFSPTLLLDNDPETSNHYEE